MFSKDYISGLPDCLICHILSFVPTKEAASTSVLAKRWRYLFALTPNLDFNNSIYLSPEKSKNPRIFVDFVDRVLVLHQKVPLNRFSLKCEDVIHPAIIVSWLLKVLEHAVLDLDLDISSEMGCLLPTDMFVSDTLVMLKLGIRDFLTIDKVRDFFLPNVKTLCLNYAMVKNSFLGKFLSGCQALEELVLDNLSEVKGSYSVSHSTLKRLVVCRSRTLDENHKSVSFSTPNVIYLDYSDTIADKYPKVEFSSLVEARLDLRMTKDQLAKAKFSNDDDTSLPEEMVGNATNFLMGICNVKILHLSNDTLEVLTYCCNPIPAFNNLINLTIQTDLIVSLGITACSTDELLKGLHSGDINHTPWEDTSVWLSSSPVKKLKVLKFGEISFNIDDIDKQMDMVKYFVETMPILEKVVLYCDPQGEDDLRIVSTAYKMLEKVASTKCNIRVISDKITLPSTVCSTSSTA